MVANLQEVTMGFIAKLLDLLVAYIASLLGIAYTAGN